MQLLGCFCRPAAAATEGQGKALTQPGKVMSWGALSQRAMGREAARGCNLRLPSRSDLDERKIPSPNFTSEYLSQTSCRGDASPVVLLAVCL